jgi:hypothetical protein
VRKTLRPRLDSSLELIILTFFKPYFLEQYILNGGIWIVELLSIVLIHVYAILIIHSKQNGK